uniref:Uncharacterized protein n=1 Tax=Amphimedon queenslandica TaxID=400682 RepID=A0A1X7SME7_AMPQE
ELQPGSLKICDLASSKIIRQHWGKQEQPNYLSLSRQIFCAKPFLQ